MKCKRKGLIVDAIPYEIGKGYEDGFEPYVKVITNGWINSEDLIQVTRDNNSVVCPYISNRRGRAFLKEGDYIIIENDGNKHVCSSKVFSERFEQIE